MRELSGVDGVALHLCWVAAPLVAPPYLCEALSGATKNTRTASTGYRALLRVLCVVAGPLGASRFAAVSQAAHRDSRQAAVAPHQERSRRVACVSGIAVAASLLVSAASFVASPSSPPQIARRLKGSGGSPRTAHGRPSGTVAWRNAPSSFPLRTQRIADQAHFE